MSVSIFDNPLVEPDRDMFTAALGHTKPYFDQAISLIEDQYGKTTTEWKFYGKKSGWILKLYCKKRNVLFLIPLAGHFRASFTFGEPAFQKIMLEELPGFNKQELIDAKKYAEGRTIQYKVEMDTEASNLLKFIRIKMEGRQM
ncbi:DUF3788 family protein [Pararcticibacter amylolyticus]|uniref:DUF3788 domain-containing protein n=1 Tax=Pararcticibacter amylolyticus TaxID=2173175 RepID=A0A2U2PC26_9SPHI|nr:DUF3788 family protein [Pararcticibacter amylolyticus]PWG78915.1 hypothetical protein DDR33_19880 [Pararcticibacter amylolyticus]